MDDTFRLSQLSTRMREEWDRRVSHDYRYWMSDGVQSDESMWLSGARDFKLIFEGISPERLRKSTVVEVGCGVGRLLRETSRQCATAIGVDVSVEALNTAQRLLGDIPNIILHLGNGIDLSCLEDESVDGAYSFAALGSMPVAVFCAYLLELNRAVRQDGFIRLQIYLGQPQDTVEEDTIVLRSFDRTCFAATVRACGFRLERTREIVLPFEVSDHSAGLVAEMVELTRERRVSAKAESIIPYLLPLGEPQAGPKWSGSQTEYLMALARARQHMDDGKIEAARESLEFAVRHYGEVDDEVKSLLLDIERSLNRPNPFSWTHSPPRSEPQAEPSPPPQANSVPQSGAGNGVGSGEAVYARNIEALRRRFPAMDFRTEPANHGGELTIVFAPTGDPVISFRGSPLAHPEKPRRAAESWADQTVRTPRLRTAEELVIGGFGVGYHIEALLTRTKATLHVFEPSPAAFHAALRARDLRPVIDRLGSIAFDLPKLRDQLGANFAEGKSEYVVYPPCRVVSPDAFDDAKRITISVRGLHELQPRISVVGPMYGGSLPISYYATRAFQSLKQRVHGVDFKSFYQTYCNLGASLKTPSRRDAIESKYVELLSDALLESLAERPVDILVCLAQAPVSPRALIELRKRGVITVMWFVEDYQRFQTWKMLAPYFDYMFMIQRGECLNAVEAAGAGRALYLPVACDPMVHRPVSLTGEEVRKYGSEISFLGAGYNNRQHLFAHLANRDFKIWGTEWPGCMPFTKLVQDNGRRIEPDEYVKIFSSSTINLNLHSSSERDGVEPFGDFVNPRTFELAASGAFQLADERTLMPEMFKVGTEMAVFHDSKEMIDRIDYYIEHPEERDSITQASRSRVLADHTYDHRMKQMLESIYIDRFDQLRSRQHSSPWHVTLEAAKDLPELLPRLQKAYQRGDEPTLEAVVSDIQTGKGSLSDTEQKILFLHHLRSQITTVQELRKERL